MVRQLRLWDDRGRVTLEARSIDKLRKLTVIARRPIDGGVSIAYGLGYKRWTCSIKRGLKESTFEVVSGGAEPVFSGSVGLLDENERRLLGGTRGINTGNTMSLTINALRTSLDREELRLAGRILGDVGRAVRDGKKTQLIARFEQEEYHQDDPRTELLKSLGFSEVDRIVSRETDRGDVLSLLK